MFTRRRALLTPQVGCNPCSPNLVTRWWNLRTDRLRVIDKAPRDRYSDWISPHGDLSAAQVAVVRGDHDRVITLPRRASASWPTRDHEWVLSWSPDDRFVLTAADGGESGWGSVAIRRARTGALVARFKAVVLQDDAWAPVWENASTISFMDGYDCGDGCLYALVVRCTVRGTCQQISRHDGISLPFERRLPPT